MRMSVGGVVRATLAAAAGVGLVAGAMHAQGALAVGPRGAGDLSSAGATAPVRGASVVCPGPELKGVQGLDDLPVGVRVAAAAAPTEALGDLSPATTAGSLSVDAMPQGTVAHPLSTRGQLTTGDVSDAKSVLVSGTQSLAPGLAAVQSWFVADGDRRSLGSVPCGQAVADSWIMAGGAEAGRQERLVLTNPGGNAVSVDVTMYGSQGAVASSIGKGLVVPPHGRTAFLLNSISGSVPSPAFHVLAQGGVVAAVVNDLWLDGTRAAGSDDAIPSAPPAREQVIPTVTVAGRALLRVAVPGDGEAVVQARVLTAHGARALPTGGVTRIAGGTVRDIDISSLPADTVGLQVRADVPIVAAAMVSRAAAGKPSDFAWCVSTAPITGVAGMPLVEPAGEPQPLGHALTISAAGGSAQVRVVTVDGRGAVQTHTVSVPADSTTAVTATGATEVWVSRLSGAGRVHAGVISWVNDSSGTLITTTPLLDSMLRSSTVGVREIQQ
jgi:Family of unknown function (DUF5719)